VNLVIDPPQYSSNEVPLTPKTSRLDISATKGTSTHDLSKLFHNPMTPRQRSVSSIESPRRPMSMASPVTPVVRSNRYSLTPIERSRTKTIMKSSLHQSKSSIDPSESHHDSASVDTYSVMFNRYVPGYISKQSNVGVRCLVVVDCKVYLSNRRQVAQTASPIFHEDFPIQEYSPFHMDIDKSYTVVSGETFTDTNFFKIAKQREIPQCMLSWDHTGTLLSLLVNNFSTSYDSILYFFTPQQSSISDTVGHCVHYGHTSFQELLENRASRNANDILSYCVQDMSWSNNGLFVYLIDCRGNVSIISRLGEFVWMVKDRDKPTHFMHSGIGNQSSKSPQHSVFKIRTHPSYSHHQFCVSDGFSFELYQLPHVDMSLVIQTFSRVAYGDSSNAFYHQFNSTPFHIHVQGYQSVLHVWRMCISHPQLSFYASHIGLNHLVDKICEFITKSDSVMSIITKFLKLLSSSLQWSTQCQQNPTFLIPHFIYMANRIFQVLIDKRQYYDFMIQYLKWMENYCQTAIIQAMQNVTIHERIQSRVVLQDCWIQLGSVIIDIIENQLRSYTRTKLYKTDDELELYASDDENSEIHINTIDGENRASRIVKLDKLDEEDDDHLLLDIMNKRDQNLPYYYYLSTILNRLYSVYDLNTIITSETFSKKHVPYLMNLNSKQKSRIDFGNMYYMLENYEKSCLQYQELNDQSNITTVNILFVTNLFQYKLNNVLSLIQQQLDPEFDIIRSRIEHIPILNLKNTEAKSMVKSNSNTDILYAMATLLIAYYQNKKIFVLPPLFCQSVVGHCQLVVPQIIQTPDNASNTGYYRPLNTDLLSKSLRSIFSETSGKTVIVRLLLGLGHVDEAVVFCLQSKSTRHMLTIIHQSLTRSSNQSVVNLLEHYNVEKVGQVYSEVIQQTLKENSTEVHRILSTARLFLPESAQLRLEVARMYLERAQSQFKDTSNAIFMKKGSSQDSYIARLHDLIAAKKSATHKANNRKLQIQNEQSISSMLNVLSMGYHISDSSIKGGLNDEQDQSFIPLYDSIQVFCTIPDISIKNLLKEYKASFGSNRNSTLPVAQYMNEFRYLCRYLWYSYLKDTIQTYMKTINPFKQIYRPQSQQQQYQESDLITLAECCGALLDFGELHTTAHLQGSLLTILSLLSNNQLISDIISKYLPDDSLVVFALQKRFYQLKKKVSYDENVQQHNPSDISAQAVSNSNPISGEQHMKWYMEQNDRYWSFLGPVVEMLSEADIVQHFEQLLQPDEVTATVVRSKRVSNASSHRQMVNPLSRQAVLSPSRSPSNRLLETPIASPERVDSVKDLRIPSPSDTFNDVSSGSSQPNTPSTPVKQSPIAKTVTPTAADDDTLLIDILSSPRTNNRNSEVSRTAMYSPIHVPKLNMSNMMIDDGNITAENIEDSPRFSDVLASNTSISLNLGHTTHNKTDHTPVAKKTFSLKRALSLKNTFTNHQRSKSYSPTSPRSDSSRNRASTTYVRERIDKILKQGEEDTLDQVSYVKHTRTASISMLHSPVISPHQSPAKATASTTTHTSTNTEDDDTFEVTSEEASDGQHSFRENTKNASGTTTIEI
jgi:hypothetical protein